MENKALDFIMGFESGEIDDEADIIAGFQLLLDEGILFQLQESYGRTGMHLLKHDLITMPSRSKTIVKDAFGNILN
jgi:hypothetical protein